MSIKVSFVLQCGLVNELPDNVLFCLMLNAKWCYVPEGNRQTDCQMNR